MIREERCQESRPLFLAGIDKTAAKPRFQRGFATLRGISRVDAKGVGTLDMHPTVLDRSFPVADDRYPFRRRGFRLGRRSESRDFRIHSIGL